MMQVREGAHMGAHEKHVRVSVCRRCGRDMVHTHTQPDRLRHGGYGYCHSCLKTLHKQFRVPVSVSSGPRISSCRRCGRDMIHSRAPRPGRRVHAAHGLCRSCYFTETRQAQGKPRLPRSSPARRPEPPRLDSRAICEEYQHLRGGGMSDEEIARRLAIPLSTLHKALAGGGR